MSHSLALRRPFSATSQSPRWLSAAGMLAPWQARQFPSDMFMSFAFFFMTSAEWGEAWQSRQFVMA